MRYSGGAAVGREAQSTTCFSAKRQRRRRERERERERKSVRSEGSSAVTLGDIAQLQRALRLSQKKVHRAQRDDYNNGAAGGSGGGGGAARVEGDGVSRRRIGPKRIRSFVFASRRRRARARAPHRVYIARSCATHIHTHTRAVGREEMARPPITKRRHTTDLHLESVSRISSFPIVESGIYIAGNVYERIKRSNSLMGWGLDTAEHSLAIATATAMPAMNALNLPIMTLDYLLCKGIDIVEQRVPAVNLPPQAMYWNTREYVNNKFVKPVLIRADSVKLIGSQAANAAVERLAGAINVADQYVDRYLPADPADKVAEICTVDSPSKSEDKTSNGSGNKAVQRTIEHGARFSRKLQRRLTRRTLAEARALKEQGTECIHVLLYVVELLATDPKLALQKAKELWASLSLPEPENQARPTNLEQLLVLFTRETARRIVHLVNGTANLAGRTPRRLGRALLRISHQLLAISEQALKMVVPSAGKREASSSQVNAMRVAIYRLNSSTNEFLEQLAAYLAGRPKAKKNSQGPVRQVNHNNHTARAPNPPPVNGID